MGNPAFDDEKTEYDEGSIEASLSAALDVHDDGKPDITPEPEPAPEPEPEPEAKEPKPEPEPEPEAKEPKPEPELEDKEPKPEPEPEDKEAELKAINTDAAPGGWGAKERELWKDLPESIKTRIKSREKEMDHNFMTNAQSNQITKQFHEMAAPHQAAMQALGVDNPIDAAKMLFTTASQLQFGNPGQKAQKIAELIQQYGVDLGTLDNLLAGEPLASPEQDQFKQMLDERLAPLDNLAQTLQQNQQSEQQRVHAEGKKVVDEFSAGKEFIDIVRLDMADMLESAGRNNREMTVDKAYELCCAGNPEISAVLAERAAKATLVNTEQKKADKLAASSSIHGLRGGEAGNKVANLSVQQTVANLIDNGVPD